MDTTDNLQLPWLAAGQAQKHVTLNESLAALDAVVQLSVASRTVATPPTGPVLGARHIVGPSPTGAWAGKAGQLAAYQDGVWAFHTPREGWIAWVAAEHAPLVFTGGAWAPLTSAGAGAPVWGVNATADTAHRLVVASDGVLLTHETANHRLGIDKAAAADTASVIFSTAFSGRAEIGLAGDDDLAVKVSTDGAVWREALRVDRRDGAVSFAAGGVPGAANLLINGDFLINQRGFAGGALAAGVFGFDRWKAAAGGCSASLGASGLSLASGGLTQVVEPAVWGEASLADATFAVTAEGLAGGVLQVSVGSASATLTAAAPSARLQTAAADTGALAVTASRTSGSPVFRRLKLERGGHATPWAPRPLPTEFILCQRYFETSVPLGSAPASYAPGAQNGSIYHAADPYLGSAVSIRYAAPKRAAPTVTIRDGAAQVARIGAYTSSSGWQNGVTYTGVLAASSKGFSLQQNNGGVVAVSFDWTAEAEL